MSVIRKDLGMVTAYAYAVSKGYTGTEEEFAELMASYADVAEEAAQSAEDAQTAQAAAEAAATAALGYKTDAQTAATSAGTSASTAASKASEAAQSATAAAGSATAAASSASTATTKATQADTAAGNAATNAIAAAQAASMADTKATDAAASATAAAGSATAAAASASSAASAVDGFDDHVQDMIDTIPEDYTELTEDVNQLKADLSGTLQFSVTPKWSRVTGTASGKFNTGNAATIHGISIDSIDTIEVSGNAKASLFLYSFGTYVGKINANYTVDKVAGSWGFYTGNVNIAAILKSNSCDEVVISIIPTDSTVLTDSSVEDWGNAHCTVKKLLYANNDAITMNVDTAWRKGSYAANGWTFYPETNYVSSDFISNVQSILVTPNAKINVAFYSKYKPIGKISDDGAINTLSSKWGYVFRELNVARYLEERFAKADSLIVTLAPLDNITLSDDSEAITFATSNCIILQSAFTTYPTFSSVNKPSDSFIKAINHRGFMRFAPENTLPAFCMSKQAGFTDVEADLEWTSDNVPVMLHDETINRTGRNADGTSIESSINIGDITYSEALGYDFGVYMGEKYEGTKIPTLEETLLVCKQLGLNLWLDIKTDLTETQASIVINLINAIGMSKHIVFMSTQSGTMTKMKTAFPWAPLLIGITSYSESGVNTVITALEALKTDQNTLLASGKATSMTDALYSQLGNANINSVLWTDVGLDFTLPFNKNVVGAFTDLQDISAESIAYAINTYQG